MQVFVVLVGFFTLSDFAAVSVEVPSKEDRFLPLPFRIGKLPAVKTSGKAQPGNVTAKVDNLHSSNSATFQQRYWVNDEWYRPNGGPQFLLIGGESGQSASWIEQDGYEWNELAKQVGAIVFVLEHRFYGQSQPTGDVDFASLSLLTSEQALLDTRNFIHAMNKKYEWSSPRWITFGYSYSGALAAWMRQKYPEDVYAAVSSSSQIQAVVDFTGYLEVVWQALVRFDPKCARSVHQGFQKVNALAVFIAGLENLRTSFKLCNPVLNGSDHDMMGLFYQSLLSNYMGVVQNSGNNYYDYADKLTIANLCQQQTSVDDGFDGMLAVNDWLMGLYGSPCLDMDYSGYIGFLKTAKAGTSGGDYRAWTWQGCNEFGGYHSTDSPMVIANFTGAELSEDFYVQQCGQVFDPSVNKATVLANIDRTNRNYFGRQGFNGTKVVFVHGINDPWHVLGVTSATNSKVYPVIVDGTGHCADIYPPRYGDSAALSTARETVRHHVTSWVNE